MDILKLFLMEKASITEKKQHKKKRKAKEQTMSALFCFFLGIAKNKVGVIQ